MRLSVWFRILFGTTTCLCHSEHPILMPPGVVMIPIRRYNNHTAFGAEFEVGKPPQRIVGLFTTTHPRFSVLSAENPVCDEDGLCKQFHSYNPSLSTTSKSSGPGFREDLDTLATGNFVNDTFCTAEQPFKRACIRNAQFGTLENYFLNRPVTKQQSSIIGLGARCESGQCSYSSLMDQLYEQGLIRTRAFSLYLGMSGPRSWGHIIFGGIDNAHRWQNFPPIRRRMLDPGTINADGQANWISIKSMDLRHQSEEKHEFYQYPSGGNFLIDLSSTHWSLPPKFKRRLFHWWKIKPRHVDATGRARLNCFLFKYIGGWAFMELNFGPGEDGHDDKMFLWPSYAIQQLDDGTCVVDIDEQEHGGVLGQTFLRMVYTTFYYNNMTVEFTRIKPRYVVDMDIIPI